MDVELDNLINRIKKDGIEEAKKNSEDIINKARQEASSIINDAHKEADNVLENARNEALKIQTHSESALRQATRDTVLVVKEKIIALLDKVFKREISSDLTPDFLKQLIMQVIQHWPENSKVEFLLSNKDKDKVENLVLSSLKESLKDSITIKVDSGVTRGFRVCLKGDNVYYDFTDDSIADFLKDFLSPSIREILEKDKENG